MKKISFSVDKTTVKKKQVSNHAVNLPRKLKTSVQEWVNASTYNVCSNIQPHNLLFFLETYVLA